VVFLRFWEGIESTVLGREITAKIQRARRLCKQTFSQKPEKNKKYRDQHADMLESGIQRANFLILLMRLHTYKRTAKWQQNK
jgi:hypothetical protein